MKPNLFSQNRLNYKKERKIKGKLLPSTHTVVSYYLNSDHVIYLIIVVSTQ